MLLGELWGYALQQSEVREIAEGVRRELPGEWTDNDAQALALEILLSNAGLDGRLRFSGVGPDNNRASIPSTYFNPQLRRGHTSHRGFNPETNQISFAPLHDVQDEVFDAACEQAVQHPDLYHDWEEVEVEAASLSTFLREVRECVVADVAPEKGKRGAKPKYDWQAFHLEALRKLEEEGGINASVDPGPSGFSQAKLERHMADWFQETSVSVPSESVIRSRIKAPMEEYEAKGWKGR
ncbi:MAG: hypothetical protein AB1592_17680 [Pseudomonadota bacterium]